MCVLFALLKGLRGGGGGGGHLPELVKSKSKSKKILFIVGTL